MEPGFEPTKWWVIIEGEENVSKSKKMEMSMAYLWYKEETALTEATGWSAIS